ncbi:MAG: hypothetical protein ACKVPX_12855 [Myxococcaceae bacterium]
MATADEASAFVSQHLLDPNRKVPIAVVASPELEARGILMRLRGTAAVVLLPKEHVPAWNSRLKQAGCEPSAACYNGVRLYAPLTEDRSLKSVGWDIAAISRNPDPTLWVASQAGRVLSVPPPDLSKAIVDFDAAHEFREEPSDAAALMRKILVLEQQRDDLGRKVTELQKGDSDVRAALAAAQQLSKDASLAAEMANDQIGVLKGQIVAQIREIGQLRHVGGDGSPLRTQLRETQETLNRVQSDLRVAELRRGTLEGDVRRLQRELNDASLGRDQALAEVTRLNGRVANLDGENLGLLEAAINLQTRVDELQRTDGAVLAPLTDSSTDDTAQRDALQQGVIASLEAANAALHFELEQSRRLVTTLITEHQAEIARLAAKKTNREGSAKPSNGASAELLAQLRKVLCGKDTLEDQLKLICALFPDRVRVFDVAFDASRRMGRMPRNQRLVVGEQLLRLATNYYEAKANGASDRDAAKGAFTHNEYGSFNGTYDCEFKTDDGRTVSVPAHLRSGGGEDSTNTLQRTHFRYIPAEKVIEIAWCGLHRPKK